MFSARLSALQQRRAVLLEQSTRQRHQLEASLGVLEKPLRLANSAIRLGQFVRQRPILFFATAGVTAVAMRRNYKKHRSGFKKIMAAFRLARSVGQLVRALKARKVAV